MEQIFQPVRRITELVKSQIEAIKTKIGQFPKVCSNLCFGSFIFRALT